MQLLTVGLNHQSAPVSLREKIAFPSATIREAVAAARNWFDTAPADKEPEAAILSTCNRTELYAAVDDSAPALQQDAMERAAHFLSARHAVPYAELRAHLYAYPQADAVRHAFRVASGLNSMVLGEPQILGQMKEAVREAEAAGGLGTYLQQMFQRSFAVAKEVRSTTEIGLHSVSMAAAAVRMSERLFDRIDRQNILFVGAGEMIELCAAHFAARNPAGITIANRTVDRAQALAYRFNAHTLRLAELPDRLHQFDIIISCTAASLPIIGLGMVERAVKTRRHRPMFMLDLAVPRDIESEAGRLPDVYLYTVDDLATVVQAGLDGRQAAVSHAEAIIESRVQGFMQWLEARSVVPVITALHQQAEALRMAELERARRMLARGESMDVVLEQLSRGLAAKFLHGPQQALHQAEGAERERLATLLPTLFQVRQ